MNTTMTDELQFDYYYDKHVKCLRLKGLRPKTIEAYSRAIRRVGLYFKYQIDNLTTDQLLDYFNDLLDSHSWSTVKLDLYGLKFFYTHVLKKGWNDIPLVKKPKVVRIPDILSITQFNELLAATTILSYKVFFLPSTVWGSGSAKG
jgi:integrase/recombinase XerD